MIVMNIKIDKRIKGWSKKWKTTKKRLIRELGLKGRRYVKEEIAKTVPVWQGALYKSIHFQTMPSRSVIWSTAPHAISWEWGMRPHYIHRNMITASGKTVGNWMDSKGINPRKNYLLVGSGQIGQGTRFMRLAFERLRGELPHIITKNMRLMIK